MPLSPGDLMFVGWDSDNEDVAFVATVDLAAGEVIYFTDDEWDGTEFVGNEQLVEWVVPTGGIAAGTVVTVDMTRNPGDAAIDAGGTVDYIRGGGSIAGSNEMFWAFQGTRVGNDVTPTNFIGVIGNEDNSNFLQSPFLNGTGLTNSNGAIIIDGDNDYMEYTADFGLPDPVDRESLVASISDLANWDVANGGGDNNPNPGGGFVVDIPDVVCFTAGTLIRTPWGDKAVETLRSGDLVLTVDDGPQPIRWIGKRHISSSELRLRSNIHPIVIRKGAFAPGLPDRDTYVSPQHRVFVSSPQALLLFGNREVLAPAVGMTNGTSITHRRPANGLTYVHVMFDRHQLIWGDGLVSESYFPGDCSLKSMGREQREEICDIFPELAADTGSYGQTARSVLRSFEARLLV